jgi:hypothetical protein
MPCRYCHFRSIVRHYSLYSVVTIISVYLSIAVSFFVTRRCRRVITLPQALLESGQTADTSRMLVQLLECAVLEQVSSRTLDPAIGVTIITFFAVAITVILIVTIVLSALPTPPISNFFSFAALSRLDPPRNRRRSTSGTRGCITHSLPFSSSRRSPSREFFSSLQQNSCSHLSAQVQECGLHFPRRCSACQFAFFWRQTR